MNKVFGKILLILFVVMLAGVTLVACGARDIGFEFNDYIIYMDKERELTPTVKNMEGYTLISSNPTIVQVLEDGKSIKALRGGGVVTLTAQKGNKQATARVLTYTKSDGDTAPIQDSTYTVTFNTLGKSAVPSQRINPGELAQRPLSPQYADYIIADWYTDATIIAEEGEDVRYEFSEEFRFDFSTPITQNLTLYAEWILIGQPSFRFTSGEGGSYISGLFYPNIEYGEITLPSTDKNGDSVIGIAKNAFASNSSLQKVIIPSSITIIKEGAFLGSSKLQTVIFEDGSRLLRIEKNAFKDCINLKTVDFGENSTLSAIESSVFENGKSLTNITLPQSLSSLGSGVFMGCTMLNQINLPPLLTSLPSRAFLGTALTYIDLQYISSVGQEAFKGAKNLKQINNHQNINSIWADSLEGTAWINSTQNEDANDKAIYLGDILISYTGKGGYDFSVKPTTRVIASRAFASSPTGDKGWIVRFQTEKPPIINDYALNNGLFFVIPLEYRDNYYEKRPLNNYSQKFYYSDQLGNDSYPNLKGSLDILIKYPARGEEIPPIPTNIVIAKYNGSASMLNLKDILYNEYGNSFTIDKIAAGAFSGLDSLVTLILPPKIRFIERYAFNSLPKFRDLHIQGEWGDFEPSNTNLDGSFNYIATSSFRIYVPADKLALYKTKWKTYEKIIETLGNS